MSVASGSTPKPTQVTSTVSPWLPARTTAAFACGAWTALIPWRTLIHTTANGSRGCRFTLAADTWLLRGQSSVIKILTFSYLIIKLLNQNDHLFINSSIIIWSWYTSTPFTTISTPIAIIISKFWTCLLPYPIFTNLIPITT